MNTVKRNEEKIEYNRAAIYARFSPGPQQREESIEGQVRECTALARRHDLTVVKTYADRRMSGTNDDRPEFQQMLRDAERGLFDVLIIWKNDRFARNRYDSAMYKHRLKKAGIKILYAKENIPDGPEGIILESVLEGLAEYYSANLAQNIRRGLKENVLEGKTIGGPVPFGFKLNEEKRYVLDPEKAPVVVEIFQRYTAGEAIVDICNDLNRRGHRTSRGGKFNRGSLHRMLSNEKYTGVYRYGDIVKMDTCPRIVSDELFSAALKMAVKNKKMKVAPAKKRFEFMLTGKLFCGNCGEPMAGTWGTSKSGKIYTYYQCNGRKYKKTDCHRKPESQQVIEELVLAVVVDNVLHNDKVIDYIINRCLEIQEADDTKAVVNGLKRELSAVEKAKKNIMTAIEAGIITDMTKERLLELEEQARALKTGIAEAEIKLPKFTYEQLAYLFTRYRDRKMDDVNFMRDVIEAFVSKIYLYDGKLAVFFNFSNGESAEINFDESCGIVNSAYVFDCLNNTSTICNMVEPQVIGAWLSIDKFGGNKNYAH